MRPIVVRDEEAPDDVVVVVRGGEMNGDTVRRTATDAFDEFGIYTVSCSSPSTRTVDELCRDRPELQRYGKVAAHDSGRLRIAGRSHLCRRWTVRTTTSCCLISPTQRSTGSSLASTDRSRTQLEAVRTDGQARLCSLPFPHGAVGPVARLPPPRRRRPHARQRAERAARRDADAPAPTSSSATRRPTRPSPRSCASKTTASSSCASCRERSRTTGRSCIPCRVVAEASAPIGPLVRAL